MKGYPMKLATTHHPYYPNIWLSKEQALALLTEQGFPIRLTVAWCKANGVNVAPTGHIGQVSLQQFIDRTRFQAQEEAL
jgi:hypothetical protein